MIARTFHYSLRKAVEGKDTDTKRKREKDHNRVSEKKDETVRKVDLLRKKGRKAMLKGEDKDKIVSQRKRKKQKNVSVKPHLLIDEC